MPAIEIMIRENESVKKLYPVTLTRAAFDINVGGYTLYEMIKEFFPNAKVSFEARDEVMAITERKHKKDSVRNPIVIDACSVPSIENMKRIEGITKGKDASLDLIEYPHQIIIWHKKICKENIEFMAERGKFERPEDGVCIGKNVLVHESCVLDTENGPIIIDDDTKVMPFAYIAGPHSKKFSVSLNNLLKDMILVS